MLSIFYFGVLFFSFSAAQSPTTESEEASISDPNAECTGYGYGPVTNALSQFPTILQIASILPNDGAALDKWASIQSSVPNIAPKNISLDIPASVGGADYPKTDPDCWWSFAKCTTPKAQGLPIDISTVPEPNTLGYGFDDGPFCGHNVFYDFLSSQNQKATMYFIGSNVMNFPLQAQRAVVDGHEICAHTWSHKYMTSLTSEDAFAELYYSERKQNIVQAIKLVTGVTPTCWRPPYGDVDDRIRAIATGLGLRTIIWIYDSNDWKFGPADPTVTVADVDSNYQDLISAAGNGTFATAGTIILTHELNNFTMQEAIKFYPMLKSAFAHITPVGVAMNVSSPYLETEYKLPSFAQYAAGTTTLGSNTINPNDTVISSLVAPTVITTSTSSLATPMGTSTTTTTKATTGTSTGTTATTTKSVAGALRLHAGSNLRSLVLCLAWAMAMGLWL